MRSVTPASSLVRFFSCVVLLAGAHAALSGAKASGCSKEQQARTTSPVQVLGLFMGEPDGTVTAEMAVVSTAPKQAAWVGAVSVVLRVDGVEVPLQSKGAGRFGTTSTTSPALKMVAGTHYNVQATCTDAALCDPVVGKVLIGEVDAPAVKPTSLTITRAPMSTLDSCEVTFAPAPAFGQVGLLRVYGPDGKVVWDGFDLSSAQFDGSKYAHLIAAGHKTFTIPAESFASKGSYRARLYLMAQTAGFDGGLSSGLGILSGFHAGFGIETTFDVP